MFSVGLRELDFSSFSSSSCSDGSLYMQTAGGRRGEKNNTLITRVRRLCSSHINNYQHGIRRKNMHVHVCRTEREGKGMGEVKGREKEVEFDKGNIIGKGEKWEN